MDLQKIERHVRELTREFLPQIVKFRRDLHQIPELAHQEYKTAEYLKDALQRMGLSPRTGVARTGLTVDINIEKKPRVAFRCDMDGLPIMEKTNLTFASKHINAMHACGHDAHTAIGLGAALVLHHLQNELPGAARILFQPAEEQMPGGGLDMIADGAIENVDAIYGVHVDPAIPAGKIGVKFGPHLASVDTFEIEIIGQMGHAAHPHLSVDSVLVASKVVSALHSIPSRKIDPVKQVVITITMIHGGEAKNVMPDRIFLAGTIRTLDEEVRSNVPELMEKTIRGITMAFDASYTLKIEKGAPVLNNDVHCTEILQNAARHILGKEHVIELMVPKMGSEDFSNYLSHIPGCQFRLGTRADENTGYSLHSPFFNIDENALEIGVEIVVQTLFEYLHHHTDKSTN